MKELLKYVGIHTKPPIERARDKAEKERARYIGEFGEKIEAANYWYHYEALAGNLQTAEFILPTLRAHHARPRRRLNISHIENVIDLGTGKRGRPIDVVNTARRLQEVVKFTRKGLRTFPETTKDKAD